jgi:hypothetical protein
MTVVSFATVSHNIFSNLTRLASMNSLVTNLRVSSSVFGLWYRKFSFGFLPMESPPIYVLSKYIWLSVGGYDMRFIYSCLMNG